MSLTRPVTYQDIANACDTLTQQNVRVSLRAIRNHIGHGSMTTISKYINEWKRSNRIAGVSNKVKRPVSQRQKKTVSGVAKKRSDTPRLRIANGDDTLVSDTPPSVPGATFSNVIEFPRIEQEAIETVGGIPTGDRTVEEEASKNLGAMWRECLLATFTPDNLLRFVGWSLKIFATLALIVGAVWLSVHISGEFFGTKGFETVLGLLLGGGILSFLARISQNIYQALSFRALAYVGTLAFLLITYSGIKDSSVKESETYTASKRKIAVLEAQIAGVMTTISQLPADFSKVRDKEYTRQDALQKELDLERKHLAQIKPSASADFSVYGHFIVRFLLDILVFTLFEVLAGFLVFRREKHGR